MVKWKHCDIQSLSQSHQGFLSYYTWGFSPLLPFPLFPHHTYWFSRGTTANPRGDTTPTPRGDAQRGVMTGMTKNRNLLCWQFDRGLPESQTVRNSLLLLKLPGLWFCYGSLGKTQASHCKMWWIIVFIFRMPPSLPLHSLAVSQYVSFVSSKSTSGDLSSTSLSQSFLEGHRASHWNHQHVFTTPTCVPWVCVCYIIPSPVIILSIKGSCSEQNLFFPSYWICS